MAGIDATGPFHGQEATVEIGDALSTVSGSDTLSNQLSTSTDFSAILTEITITDPEAAVEVQNTFGGQVMSESPHDLVQIDFTARFEDIEMMEQLHGDATTYSTGGDTWSRIEGGTTIGSRPQKAILFKVTKEGSGDQINYLLNNAIFAQMGEISLSGDGVAEITGTAYCRVADRYTERNF